MSFIQNDWNFFKELIHPIILREEKETDVAYRKRVRRSLKYRGKVKNEKNNKG